MKGICSKKKLFRWAETLQLQGNKMLIVINPVLEKEYRNNLY